MEEGLGSILSDEPAEIVETVAEEPAQTVDEPADTGEQPSASPAETPPQEDDPVERHRKGLEAAVLAERRKRQELERELESLKQPKEQPKPDEAGIARPRREAYGTQEEYEDALLEYVDQKREAKAQQERQEQAQRESSTRFQEAADKTVKAGQQKYPDFDSVINDGLAPFLTPTLQQALVLGGGHEVAYWLGKNPAEAQRVASLPPMQMALEIGRLEAKVAAQPEQPKPTLPKTLTQARDSRTGQFTTAYEGPTPLEDIFR